MIHVWTCQDIKDLTNDHLFDMVLTLWDCHAPDQFKVRPGFKHPIEFQEDYVTKTFPLLFKELYDRRETITILQHNVLMGLIKISKKLGSEL